MPGINSAWSGSASPHLAMHMIVSELCDTRPILTRRRVGCLDASLRIPESVSCTCRDLRRNGIILGLGSSYPLPHGAAQMRVHKPSLPLQIVCILALALAADRASAQQPAA